jgi:VWFA-related protein
MKAPSLTAAVVAALATLVVAQEPQVFRSGVRTVPIHATVVDASGRLIPDLTQNDFEVFDNGKPVPITLFDAQVQPISVVVALDTSGSMTLVLDFVKQAAEAFVLRLLPADRAMIANFDDRVRMSPGFTSDRDALLRHLRTEIMFGNGTKLWDALYQSAALLSQETSRKVLLVLSDGENTAGDMDGDAVLSRALDDHVMVYTIGMRNRFFNGQAWVVSRPDGFLRKLTEQTGGGHFDLKATTDLNTTFTRIADELHRQYLIGISATPPDGTTHKLDVRVKVPGMRARARKSYVAPKITPPPPR